MDPEAQTHADPAPDPDRQHWFEEWRRLHQTLTPLTRPIGTRKLGWGYRGRGIPLLTVHGVGSRNFLK
jgi:hypothetical protein